ncbi:energy transducer TonB family protein [Undibacterium crateris]|uniref:energy transducer TonB family protein n=1 Tax=Undibacterium crateris TaxID=2528175 RepID=UPI001389D55F|nr:TonB family protein [Undibacterium crateris]NDI86408.1 TonB family protein [Undibacterium crateris]
MAARTKRLLQTGRRQMRRFGRTASVSAAGLLLMSACSSITEAPPDRSGSVPGIASPVIGSGHTNAVPAEMPARSLPPPAPSQAASIDAYKREVAQRVYASFPSYVYQEQPQPLLRAVIVLRYVINADGSLSRVELLRGNGDRFAEQRAMQSLRQAAPFAKPPAKLIRGARLELSETWLFNDDGRFQVRSIALPQRAE